MNRAPLITTQQNDRSRLFDKLRCVRLLAIDDLFGKISAGDDVAKVAMELADECRRSLSAYGPARRLYQGLLTHYGKSEEAMWAQRGIVNIDIKTGNYASAESGIVALTADYPGHEDLPQAMQWLGNDFYKAGQYDKAIDCYRHVVDNSITSEYAMGAQKGVIRSSVKLKDDPNTIAAIGDLFVKFKGRGDVARAAAEVADECRRDLAAYAPARRLYEKLLAEYPDSTQAMRATRGLVNIDIKTGNYAAAEAGVQTLLTKYARHADLPKAFYYLGNDYLDARRNAEAAQCYQYTINNRPDTTEAMLSWSGIARIHIRNGDDQAATNVVNKIITDFNDAPELPQAVCEVGHEFYSRARSKALESGGGPAKEDLRKAIAVWERVIQDLPASDVTPRAYFVAAVCYSQELGEYAKGVAYYQAIVDDWPDYQYAWRAQYFVGMHISRLKGLGLMDASEADPLIEQANKAVVEKYADSESAPAAALKLARIYSKENLFAKSADYYEFYLEKEKSERDRSRARNSAYALGRRAAMDGKLDTAARLYKLVIASANTSDSLLEKAESALAKTLKAMEAK